MLDAGVTDSARRNAQAEQMLATAVAPAVEALLAGQGIRPDQAQLNAILTEAKGRLSQLPAEQLAAGSPSASIVAPIALESAQRVLGDMGSAALQQTALRAFQAGALASIPQYILDKLDLATRQAIGLADRSGASSASTRSGTASTSVLTTSDGYSNGRYLGSERYTSLPSSSGVAYSPAYTQIATGLSPSVYQSISGYTPGQVYNAALDARNIFNGTSSIGGWSSGWSAARSDSARQRFVDEVTPKLLDASQSARQEITRVFADKSGKEKFDMSKITKSKDIDAAFGVVLADAKARSKDGTVDPAKEAKLIEQRFGKKYQDIYDAWKAQQLTGDTLIDAVRAFDKATTDQQIKDARTKFLGSLPATQAGRDEQTRMLDSRALGTGLLPPTPSAAMPVSPTPPSPPTANVSQPVPQGGSSAAQPPQQNPTPPPTAAARAPQSAPQGPASAATAPSPPAASAQPPTPPSRPTAPAAAAPKPSPAPSN